MVCVNLVNCRMGIEELKAQIVHMTTQYKKEVDELTQRYVACGTLAY